MTHGRRLILVAVALCLLLVAVGAVALRAPGPAASHLDGEGWLASSRDPGSYLVLAADATSTTNRTFSYGLDLCAQTSTDSPIVLDSVVPRAFVGDPVEVLGTRVHSWIAKPPPSGITFVAGFPPQETVVAYPLTDVAGSTVANACGTEYMFEAIIGLRLMSDGWGGIDGVDVRYHVGDEHAVLTLDEQYLICAVADGCLAEAPTESP